DCATSTPKTPRASSLSTLTRSCLRTQPSICVWLLIFVCDLCRRASLCAQNLATTQYSSIPQDSRSPSIENFRYRCRLLRHGNMKDLLILPSRWMTPSAEELSWKQLRNWRDRANRNKTLGAGSLWLEWKVRRRLRRLQVSENSLCNLFYQLADSCAVWIHF